MKIQKKKFFFGGGGGWGRVGGVRSDVIEEMKFWGKLTKTIRAGGGRGERGQVGGGGGVGLVGGQGGCEQRIEVFCENSKKKIITFFWGGAGRGWVGKGGGGRVGGGGGVSVDVNEELKFFGKFKNKNQGGGVARGEVRLGVGLVGGSGWM